MELCGIFIPTEIIDICLRAVGLEKIVRNNLKLTCKYFLNFVRKLYYDPHDIFFYGLETKNTSILDNYWKYSYKVFSESFKTAWYFNYTSYKKLDLYSWTIICTHYINTYITNSTDYKFGKYIVNKILESNRSYFEIESYSCLSKIIHNRDIRDNELFSIIVNIPNTDICRNKSIDKLIKQCIEYDKYEYFTTLIDMIDVNELIDEKYAYYACMNCRHEILKYILSIPGFDPCKNFNDLLIFCCSGFQYQEDYLDYKKHSRGWADGRVITVDILLQDKRIDPSINDHEALYVSYMNGIFDDYGIFKFLLNHPKVDVTTNNCRLIYELLEKGDKGNKFVVIAIDSCKKEILSNIILPYVLQCGDLQLLEMILKRNDLEIPETMDIQKMITHIRKNKWSKFLSIIFNDERFIEKINQT